MRLRGAAVTERQALHSYQSVKPPWRQRQWRQRYQKYSPAKCSSRWLNTTRRIYYYNDTWANRKRWRLKRRTDHLFTNYWNTKRYGGVHQRSYVDESWKRSFKGNLSFIIFAHHLHLNGHWHAYHEFQCEVENENLLNFLTLLKDLTFSYSHHLQSVLIPF